MPEIIIVMKIPTATALSIFLFSTIAFANEWSTIEGQINNNADSMADACVSIKADSGAWGSGVIVSQSGVIFSAAHVYKRVGESVTVYLSKGQKRARAKVIKMDRKHDIAVLNLSSKIAVNPAKVVAKESVIMGKTMVAAGHASGYNKERKSPLRVGFGFHERRRGMIYTTCRITAGDSGGPLYNEDGAVCAVHHTMDGNGKFSAHVPVHRFFQLWPELSNSVPYV